MMKMSSGSMRNTGMPGMKLINSPATTSSTGYATRILLASMMSKTMTTRRTRKKGKCSIISGVKDTGK